MSCWCDGDDPGCSICHPSLTEEQRTAARARAKAALAYLKAATDGVSAEELVRLADEFSEAVRLEREAFLQPRTYNAFGLPPPRFGGT